MDEINSFRRTKQLSGANQTRNPPGRRATERSDLLRDIRREGLPLDLDQKGRFEGVDIHAPISSLPA
jgi:hypothetical protein